MCSQFWMVIQRCSYFKNSIHYVVLALDSMALALCEVDIAEFRQLHLKNTSMHSMCIVQDTD